MRMRFAFGWLGCRFAFFIVFNRARSAPTWDGDGTGKGHPSPPEIVFCLQKTHLATRHLHLRFTLANDSDRRIRSLFLIHSFHRFTHAIHRSALASPDTALPLSCFFLPHCLTHSSYFHRTIFSVHHTFQCSPRTANFCPAPLPFTCINFTVSCSLSTPLTATFAPHDTLALLTFSAHHQSLLAPFTATFRPRTIVHQLPPLHRFASLIHSPHRHLCTSQHRCPFTCFRLTNILSIRHHQPSVLHQ